MGVFLDELRVSPNDDGETWTLNSKFRWSVRYKGKRYLIEVPRGYSTDFGSIPRFFWRIFPPWGKYGKATVIHDWCCDQKLYSSKITHALFYIAMGDLGVAEWRRAVMWTAVRFFGPQWEDENESN